MTIKKNIYLIGLMGTGKTSIGRMLAQQLNSAFYDSDSEIEKRTGVSVSWIFDVEGEHGFREREARVIAEIAQNKGIVLATGGGSVLLPETCQLLQSTGYIVYLQAPPGLLVERTRTKTNRPLLRDVAVEEKLTQLLHEREKLYTNLADAVYNTGAGSIPKIVQIMYRDFKNQGWLLNS